MSSTQWVDRDIIEQVRRVLLRLHRGQRVFIVIGDSGWRIM
jgi:hypothetical protein